jgi:flagellar protein FlaG
VASVSASHLILFIASMLVAASVAGVFTDTVGRLSQAITDQGLDVSQDVRTDVEIISDSGSDAVHNSSGNDNITLHVKNTGSEILPAESRTIDVFVDGRYEVDVTLTLLSDNARWVPGDVVELQIHEELPDGDHRVKLIVNADEEVFEFRS